MHIDKLTGKGRIRNVIATMTLLCLPTISRADRYGVHGSNYSSGGFFSLLLVIASVYVIYQVCKGLMFGAEKITDKVAKKATGETRNFILYYFWFFLMVGLTYSLYFLFD